MTNKLTSPPQATLAFGSNSRLHALVEVCACDDARPAFMRDFVAAWNKVVHLDCFGLAR